MSHSKVQYVSQDGNNNNDGLSWATAKRRVTNAVNDLTQSDGLPHGTVRIGHGAFVGGETFPLPVNNDLEYRGSGTGWGGTPGSGTQIQLVAGSDANMFDLHPSLDASHWPHNFRMSNMVLLGNGSKQDGESNGLVTQNGGANFRVDNVNFRDFKDAGWKHTGNALNVFGEGLVFGLCGSAVNLLRSSGAGWSVYLNDLQIDSCGVQAVRFVDASPRPTFDIAQILVGLVKSEANQKDDHHNPLIYLESSTPNATGFNLVVTSVNATRRFSPPDGMTLIREVAGVGRPSRVTITQAAARGWDNIFRSDATGLVAPGELVGTDIRQLFGFVS